MGAMGRIAVLAALLAVAAALFARHFQAEEEQALTDAHINSSANSGASSAATASGSTEQRSKASTATGAAGTAASAGATGAASVPAASGAAATPTKPDAALAAHKADSAARAAKGVTIDPTEPAPHPTVAEKRAAPRFYECVKEKRDRAAYSCGGRCDIAWVGDSLTEDMTGRKCYWDSYGNTGGAWAKSPLKNRTCVIAGAMDQTQHTLYVLREVLPVMKRPKLFFVLIGTNNIGSSLMTPAQVASGIRAVVAAIHSAFPGIKVLLHTQLPRYDEPDHKGILQSRLDILDVHTKIWVEKNPTLELVNCSGVFPRGPSLQALMPDFLHPSAEGYSQWLECLEPKLEQALETVASA